MTTTIHPELMQQLAAALAAAVRPAIPIEHDLWDTERIADYLKRNTQVVRERIICLPSFPKAIRLPTMNGKGQLSRAQPLYNAMEVIKWAQSFRDKN